MPEKAVPETHESALSNSGQRLGKSWSVRTRHAFQGVDILCALVYEGDV